MNTKTGFYYGLDEVGMFVWNLLEKPCAFEQLEAAIEEKYTVDSVLNSKNLTELLKDLDRAGLIEVTGKL